VRAGDWLAVMEGRVKVPRQVAYKEVSDAADDFLERELKPDWSGEVNGARLTTNRHRMRDRPDRERAKPPGVTRVAVVGSSVVMGFGVGDAEPFPQLLEGRLNAAPPEPGRRYEVLNFGTGNSFAIHRRVLLDRKVFAFGPDAVWYVAHQDEFMGPAKHLAKLVANGNPLPYPFLREVAARAGVTKEMPHGVIETTLQPHARELVRRAYADFAAECRRRGVKPVWVYLPMPGVVEVSVRSSELVELAEAAGFEVVNLADWADAHRPAEVKVDEHHANALGHRTIADRLEAEVRRRPELVRPR
jgi:hypothetical protein